jgi:hypothetical protein
VKSFLTATPAAPSAAGAHIQVYKVGRLWYADCPLRPTTLAGRSYHEISKGTSSLKETHGWAMAHAAEHKAELALVAQGVEV